jgi:two-component system NtrC family sensor kinase
MRVTVKLTIGLVLAILPVIAVSSGVRVGREVDDSEAALHDDDVMLGRTIAGATTSVWRSAGETEARLLVDGANRREHRVAIRWVWLDVAAGDHDAPIEGAASLGALADGAPLVVRGRRPGDPTDSTFTYVAVSAPNGRRGAIEVQRSVAGEQGRIRQTIRHAAVAAVIVVGLCGALALALGALLVGRPVQRLVAQTRRIGAGDLSARLRLAHKDELGQLGAEVDTMCDHLVEARDRLATETAAKIAALEQVRHADRLATVGKLAAGMAHEIGTPLNVISGHAQLITARHPPDTRDHESASVVIQQTQRVAAIIRQLLDFARRGAPQRARVEIGRLVEDTLALLKPLAAQHRVELDVDVGDNNLVCSVDRGQIQQAITNLVVNGLQAMGRKGRLSVRVVRAAELAKIEIADTGPGIAAEVLPHIFEPFFTTKDVGEGTGLGLSVAYGIVAEHHGRIDVSSIIGEGSRFAIALPLELEQAEQTNDHGKGSS